MPPAPPKDFFKANRDCLAGLGLFLIVFLVFIPALFNGFTTYDDPEYVTSNPYVQGGLTLESFQWAFRAHGANWHPLTWLSHILDGQLYGLKPPGHHLTNVLLHAINVFLVFHVLRKLTGKEKRSFAVALLFGLHPLRVESVAWIAERKDVLSMFFFLLTLLAYARHAGESKVQSPRSKVFYGAALLLFALGLLSKSMVVTLPFVLLLLDFWPLARHKTIGFSQLALEKLPFFILAAGMSFIAYFAQFHGTAMVGSLSLPARFANALVSYCRYLGKIFWPANLCVIYPLPPGWPPLMVAGAALLLAALTVMAILNIKSKPWLAMGWFWFLGTLVPVIGIVQVGNQAMADRYSYIPSLGIFIALVWSVAEATKDWWARATALPLATAALACVCAGLTCWQIRTWRNSETLFGRAVAVTEDNTLALVGLGEALNQRHDSADAIARYRQAIQVSPGYYEAHEDLALALMEGGHLDEAIAEFRAAANCRRDVLENKINLGTAFARKGDVAEAAQQFEAAVKIDPASVLARANLGRVLLAQKDFAAAVEQFRAASKLAPQDAEIHNDLGTALANTGAFDAAIIEFQAALSLNPQNPVAAQNLARAQSLKARAKPAHQ